VPGRRSECRGPETLVDLDSSQKRRRCRVAFRTTALLLTDHCTVAQVRHTNDVDVIVRVIHKAGYYELLDQLRARGFEEKMDGDGSICTMELQGMQVDFMLDREGILGFSQSAANGDFI
jgi:hypothetical protein